MGGHLMLHAHASCQRLMHDGLYLLGALWTTSRLIPNLCTIDRSLAFVRCTISIPAWTHLPEIRLDRIVKVTAHKLTEASR